MREILFRGKSIDNGEWVYGDLIQPQSIQYKGTKWISITDNANYGDKYPVIPETVGQYTGLKDKNGNRIFEGDIFNLGDKNIRYVVVWHDTGLMGKQIRSSSYVGLRHWQDRIEIMGNSFDNPELLELKGVE